MYKEVEIRIVATHTSYHNLVLVEFHEEQQERQKGHSSFKFEAKWWVNDECGTVIQLTWEDDEL